MRILSNLVTYDFTHSTDPCPISGEFCHVVRNVGNFGMWAGLVGRILGLGLAHFVGHPLKVVFLEAMEKATSDKESCSPIQKCGQVNLLSYMQYK